MKEQIERVGIVMAGRVEEWAKLNLILIIITFSTLPNFPCS